MAKQMHYTKDGYQALVEELDYLKTTRRAEVKEALATAVPMATFRKTVNMTRQETNRRKLNPESPSLNL